MSKMFFLQRKKIRHNMSKLRRLITAKQQQFAAIQITKYILDKIELSNVKNIALFLSIDGEIDTYPLINQLWNKQKNIYVPALHPLIPNNLIFIKYEKNTHLVKNKLKFLEPKINHTKIIILKNIDIMLVPLVAFNDKGYRLGMGGGFYDRIIKNWKQDKFLPIGLAYDFQLTNSFPIANWDIPLPKILTPSKLWQWA
ncbi:MAG: 5-formyltetrahydrofolate cyclo-ligase [Pantoea sp. Brub]|nr:5-formyltetrahydrofolate cyclo-ligase [Pantoea sp. Brub]